MQLLSKYNKGIRFLTCVIDIFSKYFWVVPLKDKKGVSIATSFQSILKQSNGKPNKIWVDKESDFYNASFKKWLRDYDMYLFNDMYLKICIVMYLTNNEGKSNNNNSIFTCLFNHFIYLNYYTLYIFNIVSNLFIIFINNF